MKSISKKCSRCKEEKPTSEFWRNKSVADGFQSCCKPCHKLSVDANYKKIGARNRNLWIRYKITPEQFEVIFESQGRKCAVCASDSPNARINGSWSVDHDHSCCRGEKTCGKCIRGILCSGCNIRIGVLESISGKEWFRNVDEY